MDKFKFKKVKDVLRPWDAEGLPLIAGVCTAGCGVFALRMGASVVGHMTMSCPKGSTHFQLRVRWCRDCDAWLIYVENTRRRCKGRGMGHHKPAVLFEAPAGTGGPGAFVPPQEPARNSRDGYAANFVTFLPGSVPPKGSGV